MTLTLVQIDAFTQELFGGNSAAVVILEEWLPDEVLQKIARENNLSETAYVLKDGDAFKIRWFTPQVEVDLCGHATLAASYVLFHDGYITGNDIHFESNTESLAVARKGDMLQLDFPARPAEPLTEFPGLADALYSDVSEVYQSRDTLVVLPSAQEVERLTPNFSALATLDTFAVVVTAPGDDCDFVSRFFAPGAGINEDPVTGSAHCTLVPYWAQRLGKARLHAKQLSERRGELFCELKGDRVLIGGYCREYMRGNFNTA